MTKITRIEVIDENGRSYVNWNDHNDVQLSYQDDGRTLKIFVNKVIDPVKEAFKKVYGGYPESCDDRNFIIFKEGYNTAKQDYKVEETAQERGERIHKEVEELLSNDEKSPSDLISEWAEKNKRPSLYDILMEWWTNEDWLEQSAESIIDNLVDLIDDQFIPPHHDTNDYKWNQCLELMREKLR